MGYLILGRRKFWFMKNNDYKIRYSFLQAYIKSYSGSLTIETSLVLPIVMIILTVILYMSHLLYTENLIHSRMLIASDRLSISAVLLDKTSLVSDMQKAYQEGDEVVEEFHNAYSNLTGEDARLSDGISDIAYLLNDLYKEIGSINISNPKNILLSLSKLNSNFKDIRSAFKDGILKSLPDVSFFNNLSENIFNAGKTLGINLFSQLISETGVKYEFSKLVSDADLDKMRVSDLQIKNGAFFIPDDTISFTYSYSIFFPFTSDYLDNGYVVERKVCTRGFTGSYDANEIKAKKVKGMKKYVYVATTTEGNLCYHYLSCLRKPVYTIAWDDLGSRNICRRCKKNSIMVDKLYCVSGSSKVHFDRKCSTIYSRYVERITIEEAEKKGYRPCSKKGCIGDRKNK